MLCWNEIPINTFVEKPLSDREIEVLYYIIKGWSAKAIGEYLKISKRTVEHYSENIKSKFKTTSKSVVVEKVINYVIIPPMKKDFQDNELFFDCK
jgi:DNA-binding NarL/FixJ family response regulator